MTNHLQVTFHNTVLLFIMQTFFIQILYFLYLVLLFLKKEGNLILTKKKDNAFLYNDVETNKRAAV